MPLDYEHYALAYTLAAQRTPLSHVELFEALRHTMRAAEAGEPRLPVETIVEQWNAAYPDCTIGRDEHRVYHLQGGWRDAFLARVPNEQTIGQGAIAMNEIAAGQSGAIRLPQSVVQGWMGDEGFAIDPGSSGLSHLPPGIGRHTLL